MRNHPPRIVRREDKSGDAATTALPAANIGSSCAGAGEQDCWFMSVVPPANSAQQQQQTWTEDHINKFESLLPPFKEATTNLLKMILALQPVLADPSRKQDQNVLLLKLVRLTEEYYIMYTQIHQHLVALLDSSRQAELAADFLCVVQVPSAAPESGILFPRKEMMPHILHHLERFEQLQTCLQSARARLPKP